MNWEQRDQLSFGDRDIHAANMDMDAPVSLGTGSYLQS